MNEETGRETVFPIRKVAELREVGDSMTLNINSISRI